MEQASYASPPPLSPDNPSPHASPSTQASDSSSTSLQASSPSDTLEHAARDSAQQVAQEAKAALSDLGRSAEQTADSYAQVAARQIAGIAQALVSASEQLEQQEQTGIAAQARNVAHGLDDVAVHLERNDIQTLIGHSRSWASQNPAAFLGGSVAIGFALSRFFNASSPTAGSGRSSAEAEPMTAASSIPGPRVDPLTGSGIAAATVPSAPRSTGAPAVSPPPLPSPFPRDSSPEE